MSVKNLLKILPLALGFGLVGCNAGAGWVSGSLGTLSVQVNPSSFPVSESATVTGTLRNAFNGTNAMGAANITFSILDESGMNPSSVATLQSESCIIQNPIESTLVSCSVTIYGANAGTARVYAVASASNTSGPSNNLRNVFESITVTK